MKASWAARGSVDTQIALAGALIGGIAGTMVFAIREPSRVLVGLDRVGDLVPLHYQASVFPAFGALVAVLLLDSVRGDRRRTLLPRGAMIGALCAMALVRLLGFLPLSGHALFLSAMLAFEIRAGRELRTPWGLLWVGAGLAVTTWYKLVVWHDWLWLLVSVGIGGAIGIAAAKLCWRASAGALPVAGATR